LILLFLFIYFIAFLSVLCVKFGSGFGRASLFCFLHPWSIPATCPAAFTFSVLRVIRPFRGGFSAYLVSRISPGLSVHLVQSFALYIFPQCPVLKLNLKERSLVLQAYVRLLLLLVLSRCLLEGHLCHLKHFRRVICYLAFCDLLFLLSFCAWLGSASTDVVLSSGPNSTPSLSLGPFASPYILPLGIGYFFILCFYRVLGFF